MNESDFQFAVMTELRGLLRKDSEKGRLEVHGCLRCEASGTRTYPDILIFHRGEPWVVIELKEQRKVKILTASQERAKIARFRKQFNRQFKQSLKRGYVIYVGRWGRHRLLRGAKGSFGFWFYEIPITLERDGSSESEIKQFNLKFKKRSKLTA